MSVQNRCDKRPRPHEQGSVLYHPNYDAIQQRVPPSIIRAKTHQMDSPQTISPSHVHSASAQSQPLKKAGTYVPDFSKMQGRNEQGRNRPSNHLQTLQCVHKSCRRLADILSTLKRIHEETEGMDLESSEVLRTEEALFTAREVFRSIESSIRDLRTRPHATDTESLSVFHGHYTSLKNKLEGLASKILKKHKMLSLHPAPPPEMNPVTRTDRPSMFRRLKMAATALWEYTNHVHGSSEEVSAKSALVDSMHTMATLDREGQLSRAATPAQRLGSGGLVGLAKSLVAVEAKTTLVHNENQTESRLRSHDLCDADANQEEGVVKRVKLVVSQVRRILETLEAHYGAEEYVPDELRAQALQLAKLLRRSLRSVQEDHRNRLLRDSDPVLNYDLLLPYKAATGHKFALADFEDYKKQRHMKVKKQSQQKVDGIISLALARISNLLQDTETAKPTHHGLFGRAQRFEKSSVQHSADFPTDLVSAYNATRPGVPAVVMKRPTRRKRLRKDTDAAPLPIPTVDYHVVNKHIPGPRFSNKKTVSRIDTSDGGPRTVLLLDKRPSPKAIRMKSIEPTERQKSAKRRKAMIEFMKAQATRQALIAKGTSPAELGDPGPLPEEVTSRQNEHPSAAFVSAPSGPTRQQRRKAINDALKQEAVAMKAAEKAARLQQLTHAPTPIQSNPVHRSKPRSKGPPKREPLPSPDAGSTKRIPGGHISKPAELSSHALAVRQRAKQQAVLKDSYARQLLQEKTLLSEQQVLRHEQPASSQPFARASGRTEVPVTVIEPSTGDLPPALVQTSSVNMSRGVDRFTPRYPDDILDDAEGDSLYLDPHPVAERIKGGVSYRRTRTFSKAAADAEEIPAAPSPKHAGIPAGVAWAKMQGRGLDDTTDPVLQAEGDPAPGHYDGVLARGHTEHRVPGGAISRHGSRFAPSSMDSRELLAPSTAAVVARAPVVKFGRHEDYLHDDEDLRRQFAAECQIDYKAPSEATHIAGPLFSRGVDRFVDSVHGEGVTPRDSTPRATPRKPSPWDKQKWESVVNDPRYPDMVFESEQEGQNLVLDPRPYGATKQGVRWGSPKPLREQSFADGSLSELIQRLPAGIDGVRGGPVYHARAGKQREEVPEADTPIHPDHSKVLPKPKVTKFGREARFREGQPDSDGHHTNSPPSPLPSDAFLSNTKTAVTTAIMKPSHSSRLDLSRAVARASVSDLVKLSREHH